MQEVIFNPMQSDNNAPKPELANWQLALQKASEVKRCGAKTRSGGMCKSPSMKNGRCRMHGGKSPGAPCGEKRGRYKNGMHTKEAKDFRSYIHMLHTLQNQLDDM